MGILTSPGFVLGRRHVSVARCRPRAGRTDGGGRADIIDIGAESSRPYGDPVAVSPRKSCGGLTRAAGGCAMGRPISIDTMKAVVAAWALDHGAYDRQ